MADEPYDRLRKCLLLLSSEHDGEVVSAARQVNRLLGVDKKDWHWLAERVCGKGGNDSWETARKVAEARAQGRKEGRAEAEAEAQSRTYARARQSRYDDDDDGWPTPDAHRKAALWLLTNVQFLREKEKDFLGTMQNWTGLPTERQQSWLDSLCARYGYKP